MQRRLKRRKENLLSSLETTWSPAKAGFSFMTEQEFERRLRALQQEVTEAYLKGYAEARDRAEWNLSAAYAENERLRLALESALVDIVALKASQE